MVYKWDLHIPKLSPELSRRAYLYLPAGYDEQPDRRFPVMYMFDGHNVFFDEVLGVVGIWCAWPIGWVIATVVSVIFYNRGPWKANAAEKKLAAAK